MIYMDTDDSAINREMVPRRVRGGTVAPISHPIPTRVRRGTNLHLWAIKYIQAYYRGFPRTLSECIDRWNLKDGNGNNLRVPCPFVRCKYHLYLDVNPITGKVKLNFPRLEPWELEHTCSLQVADLLAPGYTFTLEETGKFMNITREGARQIELRGVEVFRSDDVYAEFNPYDILNEILEEE